MGVTTPQTTFSACFGAAFLVWHPTKYAEMLAEKMQQFGSNAWLVNTGWTGGPAGVGSRISLKYTRAIIDAIHDGSLAHAEYETDPVFGLAIPKSCNHVPAGILNPRNTWAESSAFDEMASRLAQQFQGNFEKYNHSSHPEIAAAGPRVS